MYDCGLKIEIEAFKDYMALSFEKGNAGSQFQEKESSKPPVIIGYFITNNMYFIVKQFPNGAKVGYYVDPTQIKYCGLQAYIPKEAIPLVIPATLLFKSNNETNNNALKTNQEFSFDNSLTESVDITLIELPEIPADVREIRDYGDSLIKEVKEKERKDLESNFNLDYRAKKETYALKNYRDEWNYVNNNIYDMYDEESNHIEMSPYERRMPTSQYVSRVYSDPYVSVATDTFSYRSYWRPRPISHLLKDTSNEHICFSKLRKVESSVPPDYMICGYCHWSKF